jgi:hypothetical protein
MPDGIQSKKVYSPKFLRERSLPVHIISTELIRLCRIFYPMGGDQPGNALLLSEGHKAAFELLSVRTGLGQRLPYRCRDGPAPEFTVEGIRKETRELLRRLNGDEGRLVRAKFESLGDAYRNTWKEGGEARVNLDAFLTKFID